MLPNALYLYLNTRTLRKVCWPQMGPWSFSLWKNTSEYFNTLLSTDKSQGFQKVGLVESYKVGCFPIRVLVEIDYFHNRYLPKWNFILIPWLGWWSSGQRACPLLRRFEFAKCRFQRTKIDRGWPFKKTFGLEYRDHCKVFLPFEFVEGLSDDQLSPILQPTF